MNSYDQVKQRSTNRCEAMVYIRYNVYARCWRSPVEVHHMLTRARGGLLLDDAGETRHLIALCSAHHKEAHKEGGFAKGLMIDGYVTTANGEPVYEGSDPILRERYGPVDMSEMWEAFSRDEPGS